MSHDPDGNQSAGQDQSEAPPLIWTSRTTWYLNAAPATLEEAAESLRSLGSAAGSARGTVDLAALHVFGEGHWEGETADAYQDHRGKLSGDLQELADATGPAADALEQIAGVLRSGQEMLDNERERLAGIPAIGWLSRVIYFPRDEAEVAAVRSAVAAAEEIRAWVDGEIAIRKAAFGDVGSALTAISDTWRPRALRHLNLNAGMGRRDDSTVRDDLDELAAAISEGHPDVVTLQEVFSGNLHGDEGLLARLEEETGAEWQVASFATVLLRDPDWDPGNNGLQPFGNAILVRTDGVVESHEPQLPLTLDGPGDMGVEIPDGVDVQERRAAVAEITVDRPG